VALPWQITRTQAGRRAGARPTEARVATLAFVPTLFFQKKLSQHLADLVGAAIAFIEAIPEDEFLIRSPEDLLVEAVQKGTCNFLRIEAAEAVNGGVEEITQRSLLIWAEYAWEGNSDLFWLTPSVRLLVELIAEINSNSHRVRVSHVLHGQAGQEVSTEEAKVPLDQTIGRIANMVDNANNDARNHNQSLEGRLRPLIEDRRSRILRRRDLSGKLGFPISRRDDAPRPVPLERKVLGVQRRQAAPLPRQRSYQDEYALDQADYEDVISVIVGMLRALERTPSVATVHRDEEFLRDILLVSLNGTFKGTATGETFVKTGKTDILVRVEDRHVFVGECKWWDGPAALSRALDQLLGYLPWRDEKGALIIFVDRVKASAVIEAADTAVRAHGSFKRVPGTNADPSSRQDFVLGHPDDPDREIKLAVLFAVIHADSG
jgi:hypothetical protein